MIKNKRIKVMVTLLLSLIMMSFTSVAANVKFISKKITKNFHLISAQSASPRVSVINMGLVIGKDGLLLIDTYLPGSSEALLTKIREISNKPIKYVLNTHSHPDHSGGNKFFADQGAIVISQENARYGSLGGSYAQLRFKQNLNLDLGGEQIQAIHVVSHTYDDTIIYLKNSNVVFMGDNLTTQAFISIGERGLAGHLAVFDLAISLANKNTLVVPAHATLSKQGLSTLRKQDLYGYKKKHQLWMQRLVELYRQGLSIDDISRDEQMISLTQDFHADGHKRNDREIDRYIKSRILIAIKSEFSTSHPLTEKELKPYIGHYRFDENTEIEVFQKQDKLYARQLDAYIVELIPTQGQSFLLKGYFFGRNDSKEMFYFDLDASGIATSLTPVLTENSMWGDNIKQVKMFKIE